MSKRKIACRVCSYGRPKCDNGRLIHNAMTRRLLTNNMEYDDKHKQLWEAWRLHTHDKQIDKDIEQFCNGILDKYRPLWL